MQTRFTMYAQTLKMVDQFIRSKKTGSPREFAGSLGVNLSLLMKLLEEMRLLGLPIEYDSKLKTYYYKQPYRLNLEISVIPDTHPAIIEQPEFSPDSECVK